MLATLSLCLSLSAPQGVAPAGLARDAIVYDWQRVTPGNTGIPGDDSQTIFLDGNGLPWAAAYTPFWEHGGMAHYDGRRWTPLSNVDHATIASPRFQDIVAEPNGTLWIGTDAGLLRYDPAVGPTSLVRYDPANSPLPGDQVRDLDIDPTGAIWMAVDVRGGLPGGGLARFSPATGEWSVWNTATGLPWGGQWPGWDSLEHVAVAADPDGGFTVWFHGAVGMATWKNGAFSWFGRPGPGGPTVPVKFLSDVPADAQGNLWISTTNGLARRAPDGSMTLTGFPAGLGSEVSVVVALPGGRAALGTFYSDVFVWDGAWSYRGNWAGPSFGSGQHTYALVEDPAGALWAGGIGGVAKLENGAWQRHRMTNTGMVGYFLQTIAVDAAGNVVMNGNAGPGVGGFTVFDGTDWTCVNDFNYGLGPPWGLPSDDVAALCPRRNGKLAVAPAGGQGAFDWDGTSFQPLIPTGYSIVEMAEDGLGRLWAARKYGNGVLLVEGNQTREFSSANSPYLGGDMVALVPDPVPGYVWIIGAFGLHRTDGVDWQVYPRELMGLNQNSIGYTFTCGDRAADGTFWLGTGRGLYHFDPATGAWEVRTPANSTLPSDDVWTVVVAPDQTVWCSTFDAVWPYPGGLTHFVGRRSTTFSAASSPLPHDQITTLAIRPLRRSYELWVGTAPEGVAVVRPGPGLRRP